MTKATRDKLVAHLIDRYCDMMSEWSHADVILSLVDIYKDGRENKGWNQMTDVELIASANNELDCSYHEDDGERESSQLYKLVRLAEAETEAHKMVAE